jgi:hypothetical protein
MNARKRIIPVINPTCAIVRENFSTKTGISGVAKEL